MDETDHVEELAFLHFSGGTSIAAHCSFCSRGRTLIVVGADAKIWTLLGGPIGSETQFQWYPSILSKDLVETQSQNTNIKILCIWFLPAEVHLGRLEDYPSDVSLPVPSAPLVAVAFSMSGNDQTDQCALIAVDSDQLTSPAKAGGAPWDGNRPANGGSELSSTASSPPLPQVLLDHHGQRLALHDAPLLLRCNLRTLSPRRG